MDGKIRVDSQEGHGSTFVARAAAPPASETMTGAGMGEHGMTTVSS